MSRNKQLEKFIANATEKQWQALGDLINNVDNRSKALPTAEFPFSYSAIAPYLEERGLITRRNRKLPEQTQLGGRANEKREFDLDGYQKPQSRIRRSVDYDAEKLINDIRRPQLQAA